MLIKKIMTAQFEHGLENFNDINDACNQFFPLGQLSCNYQ